LKLLGNEAPYHLIIEVPTKRVPSNGPPHHFVKGLASPNVHLQDLTHLAFQFSLNNEEKSLDAPNDERLK
jgi:hypothetical protein